MTKLLVTGASGFVGHALCRQAMSQGFQVRCVTRSTSSMAGVENTVVGALDSKTDWGDALNGVDVVIHLAARVHVMRDISSNPLEEYRRTNVEGTERLAYFAAERGVKRLVFVSSVKVNGEATYGGNKFSEQDASIPIDPYGISKMEAEQVLNRVAKETGLEIVNVRPPLVYGEGVKGNFSQMLRALAMRIPLPLGSVHNLRSLIYVGNLADALIVCATHPAAAGQTYLVSDGEDISTPDLLRRLGAEMYRPARLFSCPAAWLKLAARLSGKQDQLERLSGSLQIDSGKIRRDLNWIPPHSMQQGLRATAEWYRNHCL